MPVALRPSELLSKKTNVIPSIDRKTEATAEDFKEISSILNDHAVRIDEINKVDGQSKFYGFFTTFDLLKAQFPVAEEDGFAVIDPLDGNPQKIATFKLGAWTVEEVKAPIKFYATRAGRPLQGEQGVWYIVKDEKIAYLWYDGKYNGFGQDGANGLSAYDLAVAVKGFEGTEEQWLESLQGKDNYQLWLDAGNVGTYEDFFEASRGPEGLKGDPGAGFENIPPEVGKIPETDGLGGINWINKPTSGGSVPVSYLTMAEMYAAQANQVPNGSYRVDDASAHSKVGAGRAWFDYNGGITATEEDYILRSEEESMNLDVQLTDIENRLTALENQSIEASNAAAGAFSGVFETTGGNAFYDDYLAGEVVNFSLGANPKLGETWTVRVKGDLTGDIPSEWNFSGQPVSNNAVRLNELTLMYVKIGDVRIVNRIFDVPDSEAPSAPRNLTASNTTDSSTTLTWDASTDNVGIASYNVYKDGVLLKNVSGTSTTVTELTASTSYSFRLSALDAAGNESAQSTAITVTTVAPVQSTYVDWEQEHFAIDEGNGTLSRDGFDPSKGWRQGAFGSRAINGNNAISFDVTAAKVGILGLTNTYGGISTDNLNMDIAVFVSRANNTCNVFEDGTDMTGSLSWASGLPTIRLTDGVVTVELGGVVVYTSGKTYTLPLTPIGILNSNYDPTKIINAEFETINNLVTSPL